MERRTVRGVHFIRVEGDATSRGRQHATLLKDLIPHGAIPALAKKNEWIIKRSPGFTQLTPVQKATIWFLNKVLLQRLDRNNTEQVREMMRQMSQASGVSYETYLASLFQADVFMLLCRLSVMRYTLGQLPPGALPGCTSAVTLRDWTKSGRLLACRNQDYPMVGFWEPNTTVVFNEPSESGQIPHIGITTAGVHTSGLTAMNREGLTLFTHAHFGRKVSLKGMPVIDIGNEIISTAKTLGQAIDIAKRCKPYANWAFIVSSARENEAVVLEMTPDKLRVRPARDGFLAHSNYFHSRELQASEALMSGAYTEDLQSRYCRIRQVLEPHRGHLEPSHMSAALGDHVDYLTGEERVMGNTVSVVTTIKSTVFDPDQQRFWISCRGEAPMGLGDFLEIDVDKFWSKPAPSEAEQKSWPVIMGYKPRNPALIEGMRHYRQAYRAFHMETEHSDYLERTLVNLRLATRAFPSDANLWVQTGIVATRLQLFDEAKSCFVRAGELKLSPHTQNVRDLYLARCLDVEGRRSEAKVLYRQAKTTGNPRLRKAARKGLWRPYRPKQTASMMIDLQFPDTFHY